MSIPSDSPAEADPELTLVVFDAGAALAGPASADEALTVWAACSDDPAGWDELAASWPRYRTSTVPEFADALRMSPCGAGEAGGRLHNAGGLWVAIDLPGQRVMSGDGVREVPEAGYLEMSDDPERSQPVRFQPPPWWEVRQNVGPAVVLRPREEPAAVPACDRDLLFGDRMLADVLRRVAALPRAEVADVFRVTDAERNGEYDIEQSNRRHACVAEVHRQWLMEPRDDLSGGRPRDLLHGAHDWSNAVIEGQRTRYEHGFPVTALPSPADDPRADAAPMGFEEFVMYFDLCRAVIEEAFVATADHGRPPTANALAARRDEWLEAPLEGGSPPRFVIACDRRRVPRGAGVPIVGMTDREPEHGPIDCDCPLCDMAASGMFGTSFAFYDGHHLDLDDEFAFSVHERREDWEEQQREFAEAARRWDEEKAAREAAGDASVDGGEDPFASAWDGYVSDAPLPGDEDGTIALAFRLAELVGDLKRDGTNADAIDGLNDAFRGYRDATFENRDAAAAELCRVVESLADGHADLRPKLSDFQSRVHEAVRDDVPF